MKKYQDDNYQSSDPNYSSLHPLKSQVEEVAEKMHLVCFYPDDYTLQLDLDYGRTLNDRAFNILEKNGYRVLSTLTTRSKSGNHHMYIRLETPLDAPDRIALQAALGSDPVREALSVLRNLHPDSEYCSVLFETPKEEVKVRLWQAAFNTATVESELTLESETKSGLTLNPLAGLYSSEEK